MTKIIEDKIKKSTIYLRFILIGILLLILAVLIIIKPDFKGKKSFGIDDKCGKFVNLVSHTIEDEAICIYRCRAQCDGIAYKYDKVEFKTSTDGCNSCTCFCK